YELIYIMKAAENLPGRIIKDSILNKINVHLGQDVRPLGVAFYRGIPAAPHEFIVVNVSPVLVPFQESSRLKIDITYRGTDSEKAINFIKDMPIFAKKLVEALSA
ncbi:MAG: hypothetical protein NDP22_02195, partial [Crenarchaeota archaeon]|nr:hypothetical protein [Thermoproteota archaeon]